MTTKTDEQERVDFEAWVTSENEGEYGPQVELLLQKNASGDYSTVRIQAAWEAWQAGRAALQSQPMQPEISRDLLGGIVDQVFGGAIEDTTVIEDIYRVIACDHARRIEGEGK